MLPFYKNFFYKSIITPKVYKIIFLKKEIVFLYFLKLFIFFFNIGYYLSIGKQKKKNI